MIGKSRHILFEVLEPRIMLSGDGLLNAIMPDEGKDTLLDGMEEIVQCVELLDTNEQVEEQISQEPVPSDTSNTYDYQPVLTLLVDENNAYDESADADLSVDNIGPTKVNGEIAILSNDSDGDRESKVGTTEDDGPGTKRPQNITPFLCQTVPNRSVCCQMSSGRVSASSTKGGPLCCTAGWPDCSLSLLRYSGQLRY